MIATAFVCILFCAGADKPTAADTFCTVWQRAAPNGLRLTRDTVNAMSERELNDVAGLKEYAERNCPKGTTDGR